MENHKFKIKVISPFIPHLKFNSFNYSNNLPYGAGILVNALRQNNYSVNIIDMNAAYCLKKHYSALNKFYKNEEKQQCFVGIDDKRKNRLALMLLAEMRVDDCNLIGFSLLTLSQLPLALLLAQVIRENKKIPIVFGGAAVTLYWRCFFSVYNFIDFAVVGEGEIPLVMLIEYLQGQRNIQTIPSLCYRDKEQVTVNERLNYDINDQPVPDYRDLDMENYRIRRKHGDAICLFPYQTSRGCAMQCSYCAHRLIGAYQAKDHRKIIDDLMYLKAEKGLTYFLFTDSCLNSSYEHIFKLCDSMIKNQVNIKWGAFVHIGNLDENLIEIMGKAGCVKMTVGIESGSRKILNLMNKQIDLKNSLTSLSISASLNIKNELAFIAGFPLEDRNDISETFEFIRKSLKSASRIDYMRFQLVRNSTVYNNPSRYDLKIGRPKNYFSFNDYNYEETGILKSERDKLMREFMKKMMYYRIILKLRKLKFMCGQEKDKKFLRQPC